MAAPASSESEFLRWVDQARGGDASAQSRVLEQLEPMIRGYMAKRIGARHDSLDDLVQNTMLRVFRGFKDLNESASIQAFTIKAAIFELQDLYRGRYSSKELTLSEDAEHPSTSPTTEGLQVDIDRALQLLTPKARQIIELKVLGYPYKDIAGMVDTTEAAVKMQVKRALEKLSGILSVQAWTALALILEADLLLS